jgi:hypothetical protein
MRRDDNCTKWLLLKSKPHGIRHAAERALCLDAHLVNSMLLMQ